MNKSERQAALTRIINQKPIATQEELLAALKAAGIDATHDTIVVISPDEKQAKWFEAAYRQAFNS